MSVRLGGYARERKPLSPASKRQWMLIVAAIVAVHLGAGAWWLTHNTEAGLEMREYVTYYDIAEFGTLLGGVEAPDPDSVQGAGEAEAAGTPAARPDSPPR